MNDRKIYGIGETLIDIIFKDGYPQAAKPGGSILNCLVSLGRTGLPASLISEFGKDDLGRIIDEFLKKNGVDTKYTDHFTLGNTAVAIAVLNEKNDASYTFYKNYPLKRLDMQFPSVAADDIIMCGSIYAITQDIRKRFIEFISMSSSKGAIILYDPNFRKAHAHEINDLKPLILENMQMASIVRGSDEDFMNIFGTGNPKDTWEIVKEYCKCLVYTASADGVSIFTPHLRELFPVRKIVPVSTIGAGDNFNAGIIASLYRYGIGKNQLSEIGKETWEKVISTGIDFASEVCMSYDNYISSEFAARYIH